MLRTQTLEILIIFLPPFGQEQTQVLHAHWDFIVLWNTGRTFSVKKKNLFALNPPSQENKQHIKMQDYFA